MPYTYTSDELVNLVKLIGKWPNAASTSTANILQHLSAALQGRLAPEIIKVREDYYATSTRMALTVGTDRYRIPARSMGEKLRDLYLVKDGDRHQLDQIERDDLDSKPVQSGDPTEYYIEGNNIILYPNPNGTGQYLETTFYFRPSDLVEVSTTRKVSQVVIATKTVTLDSAAPAGWGTGSGLSFDIHSGSSPFEVKGWGMTSTGGISGTTFVFDGALDGSANFADSFKGHLPVLVGDYICLAQEAAVPYLPRDFHPLLARAACVRIAEADGDTKQAQMHEALFQKELDTVLSLIKGSRVDSKPKVLSGDGAVVWN